MKHLLPPERSRRFFPRFRSPDIDPAKVHKTGGVGESNTEKLMIHNLLDILCFSGVVCPHESTTDNSTERD